MQISDEKKSKAVGIVRINLGTYITEQEAGGMPQVKRLALEKCPDKAATIEFSLKTTLVNANASGQDNLSQMSDVLSAYDSGPESEFDFNDSRCAKNTAWLSRVMPLTNQVSNFLL